MARQRVTPVDYVTVACKLPAGLQIRVPDTDIDIKLNGTHSVGALAEHGMTDIKKEVWDAVVAYYKGHPGAKWLHNGVVFAMADRASAADAAEEREDVNYGFDPIDPNDPQHAVPGVKMVQPDGAPDTGAV